MSVEVKGVGKLMADLEAKIGGNKMRKVSDDALRAGAEVFVNELKREFEMFKKTGASIEEITLTEVRSLDGNMSIKVHWRGPKQRYRVIHLNEFGTIKQRKPEGKGAIARALKNAEDAYRKAIRESIERGL